ncbi:MAG: isopentenyl transferase family protein, partial [Cyanobacteria bacterium J06639_18]
MTKLIVICGATATGKSGLALALAMRLGTVILSADSRQVYREFDIGTAKPTPLQQKLVPHYLVNICDPRETMTVADFQLSAQSFILEQENQPTVKETEKYGSSLPLFLVGGTGLYIKSIVRGMKIPRVAPHPELRSQLYDIPQSQLYGILEQVDDLSAKKIHPNDSVRTIRALEV